MNRWIAIAAMALACSLACNQGTGDVGGETHWNKGWLTGCISDRGCPSGLSCIENLCTVACTIDAACAELGAGALCLDVGAPGQKACAVLERLGCSGASTACTKALEGWYCVAGGEVGCALPIEICTEGTWQPATLDDCRDTITRSMPVLPSSSVYETQVGDAPVALDILFVVDNSSSMHQEERGVAIAFESFITTLEALIESRPRVAVTTVDAQCEVNDTTIHSARGSFNSTPARAFPPPAQFTFRALCESDADCEAAACERLGECGSGQWTCRTTSATCLENPNGSVNTTCRRRCTTDEECQAALGDDDFFCQMPSATPSDNGCLLPPPTEDCPADLPPFLEGDMLRYGHCPMVVGVNQEKCLKFEQGLEASRLALDPAGPNAEQVAAFVRPEAILVVIYISDEDDCSVASAIGEDDYETCSMLPTVDEGGPLIPTAHYVHFLRNAKAGGRVMTMAFIAQSLETDPALADAEHAAYVASKTDPRTCFHQTYLCETVNGVFDWGKRYAEVASAFGPDGHVENLCTLETGFAGSLGRLAAKIAANAKRVCLPDGIGDNFVVSVVRDETGMILEPGPGELGYEIVEGAPECDSVRAIAPNMRLQVGDRIRIHYD